MPLSVPDPLIDSSGSATARHLSGKAGRAAFFNADFKIIADIPDLSILDSDLADDNAPDLVASAKAMEAIEVESEERIPGDTEPVTAPQAMYKPITLKADEKDLVGRLLDDELNKVVWEKLLYNKFVEKMRTSQGSDQEVLKGFKWYMVQDFMYCLTLMHFGTNRAGRARSVENFNVSADELGAYAAYTKDILKVCTTLPPKGLGISGKGVLTAPPTVELIAYTGFQSIIALRTNWVMGLVVMIPCIQSYYEIAKRLEGNSADKSTWLSGRFQTACTTDLLLASKRSSINSDSLWYSLWVKENASDAGEEYAKQQRVFFIQHYDAWKNCYDKASRWFRLACLGEISLWGTGLNPGNVTS